MSDSDQQKPKQFRENIKSQIATFDLCVEGIEVSNDKESIVKFSEIMRRIVTDILNVKIDLINSKKNIENDKE